MPFQNNVLAGASGATGYDVPYSLRFRAANSANLRRTFSATSTNFDVQTLSLWFKRGRLTLTDTPIANCLVTQFGSGGNYPTYEVGFDPSTDNLVFMNRTGAASYNYRLVTTAQYRDPSAWYHLVIAYDSSLATSTDRIKIWINGVQVTSFSTATYPAQNLDSQLANNTYSQPTDIGSFASGSRYFDGYMAEVNFIDGQALTPSSFGQTDATTGVWVPKKYFGTYGTNGFYLKFADASAATATAIGKDSSGNGNNFTPSGISVTSGTTFDQMLDTPTLNYCVLNPVNPTGSTLSNANLSASIPFATNSIVEGSISPSTGKWYWEVTVTSGGVGTVGILVAGTAESYYPGYTSADGISYRSGGSVRRTGSTIQTYTTFTTNDVIGIALDLDNGKVFFSKNGTWQGSSDPAAGTNPAASTNISDKTWNAANGNDSAAAAGHAFNFGQRAFAYTPPTGFKALNSANLPTPSIKKGSLYMDATLRTGTGATASVSSLGFQPDLVWIKSRSAATDHGLYDAVRGVQKQLESNTTTAETTETTGLTAFNSNGYTVGALAQLNTSAATYVDWAWRETLTAGFDIMTYTGNGVSGRTVAHSLGVTPAMIIVKNRDSATAIWSVAHKSLTAGYNVGLNLTNAQFQPGNSAYGGISAFDSSTFTVVTGVTDQRNVNTNGDNYVAYLWSEIEGFSKFGSYVGNGSTDGPFVWCGHRPRWLLVKRISSIGSWYLIDTARNPYNATSVSLLAENSVSEGSISNPAIDIVSNGMKIRNTIADFNSSGGTFIFASFAENPFKYARAR